jgi:lactose/L-arabinose transport system ATP-binding protein
VTFSKTLTGALPSVGDRLALGIRPEHFGPAGQGAADLTLKVDVTEHLGSTSFLYANTTAEQLIVERPDGEVTGADTVTVSIPESRALLFNQAGERLR